MAKLREALRQVVTVILGEGFGIRSGISDYLMPFVERLSH